MKVFIIGANGMIGSAIFHVMSLKSDLDIFGSIRNNEFKKRFNFSQSNKFISGLDVDNYDILVDTLDYLRPDVVINCAGITKHKYNILNPLVTIPINSLMPHKLAKLCNLIGAKLIHISTDCVFSGNKGNYTEVDTPDAFDLYGKSKELGEVTYPNTLTLRTSTIGHEYNTSHGLLEWFLSQKLECKGFKKAIFSGLPTVIFAEIIRDVILPRYDLQGLYHISAEPINKYDLLELIKDVYKKDINIIPDSKLSIDRSLNSDRFFKETQYQSPNWSSLVKTMYNFRQMGN